jgi:hypothetical protein
MTLRDRIQRLVDSGHTRAALAKAAGRTNASVTQWLNGNTLEIKSESAAGLQALTGFNALWIATGKGPERVGAATPVKTDLTSTLQTLSDFLAQADPEDRETLQGLMASLVRKPGDERIMGSIALMLENKAFVQNQKFKA